MAVRIQIRRDTSTNWSTNNPVLYPGEIGFETDTKKFKIGPAVSSPAVATAWNSITAYANVVPSDLSNTLNDYILAADLGEPDGPAKLNVDGDLLIPSDSIIFEGATADSYETTLIVTDPTDDRTITLPNATGTVVLKDSTDTLTNKTFNTNGTGNNFQINGNQVNSYTGSGSQVVLSNSPSISTGINFNGSTSGQTTISASATASGTLTLPAATDTLVGKATTDTLTNKSISGSTNTLTNIPNNALTNSSITINGFSISLGGEASYSSDNISEGTTNKYFSNELAQDAVGNALGSGLSYNDSTGAISVDTTTIQARVADVSDTEIGYLNGVTSAIQTQIDAKLSSATASTTYAPINNPTFTGTVTLPGNPGSANEAATKSYVDNISAGLNFHAAVHAATTADLSATYDNTAKTLSASGTFPQIDGHTINETERVLVKSQSSAVQNGIYTLTDDGDPSGTWVLTRASDSDNSPSGEIAYGDFTFVQNGSTNGGQGFIMTTTGTITLGTSNIVYTQFNTGQAVVAGNGLSEATPGTLSINTAITADLSTAQTFTNKTLTSPKINEDVALTATATELNVLDGITSSTAELNILDGVTSSAAELNILDGATLSTTELNYVDGVTSAIQTQLDAKSATGHSHSASDVTDFTEAAQDAVGNSVGTGLSYNDTTGAISVDTATIQARVADVSDTEIGYLNGVTSAIQTQLDGKVDESLFDTKGDILVASADNTPAKLAAGTNGYLLTANSSATYGIEWAAAPVSLPSQTGNGGKYLTTDGSTASWATLVVPIETGTATLTANTATTVDTTALSAFTSIEYMVSLKQGSKTRTSKVIMQTDGTSVDMTEFAITETGGAMSGVVVSATTVSTDGVLQVTVTDASSSNVTVKFSKVKL